MTLLLRMLIHQVVERAYVSRRALCLAGFGLSLAACGDDDKGSQQSAVTSCAHDVLEVDLMSDGLAGPGVDPSTGKLKLESGAKYVVSSTYGVPKPDSNGAPVMDRYLQIFAAVEKQLQSQPGLLAMQLGQSGSCGSGRTLAVWKSEEEMYDFVTSQAHVAAMTAANDILKPGYAVTHWEASAAEQMTFEEGARQLAKIDATP